MEVRLRVYAKCLDEGQDLANARIEAAASACRDRQHASAACAALFAVVRLIPDQAQRNLHAFAETLVCPE